jgi:hypothetical protein
MSQSYRPESLRENHLGSRLLAYSEEKASLMAVDQSGCRTPKTHCPIWMGRKDVNSARNSDMLLWIAQCQTWGWMT